MSAQLESQLSVLTARRLLLIRHARTQVVPRLEPAAWPLHDDALRAVDALAGQLQAFRIAALVSSGEPKAVATAGALGARLSLEPRAAAGLHEHERSSDDFVADAAAFEQHIGRLFRHPDRLVFGRESADQACARFAAAVDTVLLQHQHGDVAIVAHGTVITLFVARHNAIDPMRFWRGLGMPDYVVLRLPGYAVEQA